MGHEYLIEKIVEDAKVEAKKIVTEAQKVAKGNVAQVKKRAGELLADAHNSAKRNKDREKEIDDNQRRVREKLAVLGEKTAIVDAVFDDAFESIKFNWRVEKHPKYEDRWTKEALMQELRTAIEADVVRVLYD